jgi:hypothetical protein
VTGPDLPVHDVVAAGQHEAPRHVPAVDRLDQPQEIYVARGADRVRTDPTSTMVRWVPLSEAVHMIDEG